MHTYRLTKFDLRLRLPNGRFDGEDWASINDIGWTFNGVVLTHERYAEVENAHIAAVEAFARESGVSRLALREPSMEVDFMPQLHDGFEVSLDEALDVLRVVMRDGGIWCRLESEGLFQVQSACDYFVYVESHLPCSGAVRRTRELGLFAEPCESLPDPRPPYYPGADDAFWAEVDRLAERAGEPIPAMETWVGNQDRWHLVGSGERPVFAPRAILGVFAEPPKEVDDSIGAEAFRLVEKRSCAALIEADGLRLDYLSKAEHVTEWLSRLPGARRCGLYPSPPALEAVLPDPDGVVRARWSR